MIGGKNVKLELIQIPFYHFSQTRILFIQSRKLKRGLEAVELQCLHGGVLRYLEP